MHGTVRWPVRSRLVAAVGLLGAVLLVAGCSSKGAHDPLQASASLAAATPASSPPPSGSPPGTVIPVSGDITSAVVEPSSGTLAVAVDSPPSLRLYDTGSLDDPDAPARTVDLPAPAGRLSATDHGVLVPVPSKNLLLRVRLPDASVQRVSVKGHPRDAVSFHGRTLVATPGNQAVTVVDGDHVVATIKGSAVHPDQILVAGGQVVVLDRLRSALFDVDVADRDIGAGLRAGQGAAHAVADDFGRVLVTDARRGSLLAFTPEPMTKRQMSPAPGTPFGIAYDGKHDIAWVTATASNEVVAYDVARGQAAEKRRIPTVRQPDVVTVDPSSGAVIVGSGAGKGIQVVRP